MTQAVMVVAGDDTAPVGEDGPALMRRIELERADASRKTLEAAIKRIEDLEGIYKNDIYPKAWKVARGALASMLLGIR